MMKLFKRRPYLHHSHLEISYLRKSADWNQKLMCITHTDRPVEKDQCDRNFLELRYSKPDRLPPAKPFKALTPSRENSPYLGNVTVWEFQKNNFQKPQLLAYMRPKRYKPQFAMWHKQRLWILGLEVLEIYDSNLALQSIVKDPWLSGAHTIFPDNKGHLLISCSASDSVLVVDEDTLAVAHTLRMPEALYGFNYPLSRTDSVVDHYIINDYQLTHINCAWPQHDGILVSTLIQGAIGRFDEKMAYRELLQGFVGCHGVRTDYKTNQIYFSDSCLGSVVFLSPDYTVERRVNTGSIWLHDAQQLHKNIFALSVADRNQIEIMNFSSMEMLSIIPCNEFGNSTQFIYYGE